MSIVDVDVADSDPKTAGIKLAGRRITTGQFRPGALRHSR